jgi:superfamily II DNA or RNA helicase
MAFDRERQAIERTKVMQEVLTLNRKYPLFVLECATGVGKGLMVLKCIEEDPSPKKWLILVPEILQVENMHAEIRKHGMEYLYEKIEAIICYASFRNYEGRALNLATNEAHRLSQLKADISRTIDFDRIIADSATIPYGVKKRLGEIGEFYYYTITLQEAIDRGILPEPSIYTVGVYPDNDIRRNTVKYGAKKSATLTDKKYVEHLDKQLEYWKERFKENPDEKWIGNKLNQIGNIRKKWLAERKTDILKELLLSLKGKRYICFTGSLEQCNEVGGKLSVHSKKTKKHNISVLEGFNNLDINEIYVLKMGQEGLNLTDIQAVIITQLGTGSDDGLQFLQISGRGMRATSPEIYILYMKDTKDETFLAKALSNISQKYVKELNID